MKPRIIDQKKVANGYSDEKMPEKKFTGTAVSEHVPF